MRVRATALPYQAAMWLSIASVYRRSLPIRDTSTGIGTLPFRKPGILTLSARSDAACSTAWWTSACGTSTVSRTLLSGSSSTWALTAPLEQTVFSLCAHAALRDRTTCRVDAQFGKPCQRGSERARAPDTARPRGGRVARSASRAPVARPLRAHALRAHTGDSGGRARRSRRSLRRGRRARRHRRRRARGEDDRRLPGVEARAHAHRRVPRRRVARRRGSTVRRRFRAPPRACRENDPDRHARGPVALRTQRGRGIERPRRPRPPTRKRDALPFR